MTVKIGSYEFDRVDYDAKGDVLYLAKHGPAEVSTTLATPEGHAVLFDEAAQVIGVTLVNAKWLVERDGKISITKAEADDLAPLGRPNLHGRVIFRPR
jgi:uncharacterized protein YuzE